MDLLRLTATGGPLDQPAACPGGKSGSRLIRKTGVLATYLWDSARRSSPRLLGIAAATAVGDGSKTLT
jgi:hypothetical protein